MSKKENNSVVALQDFEIFENIKFGHVRPSVPCICLLGDSRKLNGV